MSIFARQLQYVLKQHGKTFGQLYSIHVEDGGYDGRPVSAQKIKNLRLAVADKHAPSVTLNRYELEAVQQAFDFEREEIERLHAALAAESIQRFLLERIKSEKAILVAEALFCLLFDADDSVFFVLRRRMLDNIRNSTTDYDDEHLPEVDTQYDLGPAIEAYETALIWLDTARTTPNPILYRGYLAMATSLLTSAGELLDGFSDETIPLLEWRQAIALAMRERNDMTTG